MIYELYEKADFDSVTVQCVAVAASFLFFVFVYVTSLLLSSPTFTFQRLSIREKVFWNLTVARGVFGAYSFMFSSYCLMTQDELFNDVVFGKTKASLFLVSTAVGFFAFECVAFFTSAAMFGKMDRTLAVHHALALVSFIRALYLQIAHFFALFALVLEMTTPFTCICWGLLKAKLMHTRLWLANQWMLVHLFHCRSLIECYLWYKSWMNWNYIWTNMPGDVFFLQFFSMSVLSFILTPYWTYKKTMQLLDPTDWNHPQVEKKSDVPNDDRAEDKDKTN